MANLVADIFNQALDSMGSDRVVGDPQEGSREAQVLLRAYRQCLMQLLRAANWNFARRQDALFLLADATGNTPNVGTRVLDPEFIYEYAYPTDCVKIRFIPWNPSSVVAPTPSGNIALPNTPMTTGGVQQNGPGRRLRPGRWIEGVDPNYPPPPNANPVETQGISPQGRSVVMTNVRCASAVYTGLMLYPSNWDALFRSALVSYLSSETCLPILKDKKMALAIRPQQIAIVKQKLDQARITDGNEGTYSSDIPVDWIQTRYTGGDPAWGRDGAYGYGPGAGWGNGGWNALSFADGSAY